MKNQIEFEEKNVILPKALQANIGSLFEKGKVSPLKRIKNNTIYILQYFISTQFCYIQFETFIKKFNLSCGENMS
jgi:hypothetical protein